MRKIRDVLRLTFESRMSHRMIEKAIGVSRKTVADYLRRMSNANITWPLPIDLDDATLEKRLFPTIKRNGAPNRKPDWSLVNQELKEKGATLAQLHVEYLIDHPDGMKYSNYCTQYREYKKTLKRSLRQIHTAGEKVFVDYAGPTIPIHDIETGKVKHAQIFVGVLGASNYIYADAVWNQRKANWIASHVRMFEHFGGVPLMVICDNLKSAVTKPNRSDPVIQTAYQDMASHYGTAIFPARVYKPKDKSKAEGGVLIIERWIMFRIRKQVFTSLSELNATIKTLLVEVNNRPFQKMPGSRFAAFQALDKPALKPLLSEIYEYKEFYKVRAGYDYHVEIDGHFYSVPHVLVRKQLEAIVTASTIELLHGGNRVASHPRSYAHGEKTTNSEHMNDAHRHYAKWDAEHELEWAVTVGINTHAFLKYLLAQSVHRDFGYRWTTSIKSLYKKYGDERLEAACKLALEIGVTKTASLHSILKNNLDKHNRKTESLQEADFEHDNIRGASYYH
ncbi:IS21 family transposase [Methylovorus sp. MM2]|uniref:IS21 family transposase n=1 Tax=Methylovorus sp. MM2 TaxID=1848038 RepID=UPI0009EEE343|nr:IS21 family transposase [Methylovorus sp. MM2]